MLRTSVRGLAFFSPSGSGNLGRYVSRQLREKASVEVFETNYKRIEEVVNASNSGIDARQDAKPGSVEETDNCTFVLTNSVVESLLNPVGFTEDPEIKSDVAFVEEIKRVICDSNSKKLYDYIKNNVDLLAQHGGSLSDYERSVIIRKLVSYDGIINQRSKYSGKYALEEDGHNNHHRSLTNISNKVFKSMKHIMNILGRFDLSIHDYDNIITYLYKKNSYKRCIDMISKLEKTNQLLTNNLWLIKLEILTRTNINFRKIYGLNIFKTVNRDTILRKDYSYPNHSNNFDSLVRLYEARNEIAKIPETTKYLNFLISNLGKIGDIKSLDQLLEAKYGIKINRTTGELTLMKHINVQKNISKLVWPTSDTLVDVLYAYLINGDFATGIKVNNLIIEKFLKNEDLVKYWTFALRSTGIYGDSVDRYISKELKKDIGMIMNASGSSNLSLKYKLFDSVWDLAIRNLSTITPDMVLLKIKYSSIDTLINDYSAIEDEISSIKFNLTKFNVLKNQQILFNYIKSCCLELSIKSKFLEANSLIEMYIMDQPQKDELSAMLKSFQDEYAFRKMNERKTNHKLNDDDSDNDFDLW